MAYIGKQPIVGNFQVCDAISVVNGQAAYTMQVNSTNVTPETAFHMLVSLNGVLQKPGSSFTISGSTITFASNLATGDVIDFIILLGDVLNIGAPSDDTVSTASIQDNAVTSAKISASLGKVLQVVQTYITSVFQTTSSSLVDVTNLTAAITPSATSSKVLVILNTVAGNDTSSTNRLALLRGSTDIGFGSGGSGTGFYEHNISPQGVGHATVSYHFLDSPSTTSATTYKIQTRADGGTLVIGGRANAGNPCASTLTLIEIGA